MGIYRVGPPVQVFEKFRNSLFFSFLPFFFFSILHFLFCLSLGGPFSSGAPGHCIVHPCHPVATPLQALLYEFSSPVVADLTQILHSGDVSVYFHFKFALLQRKFFLFSRTWTQFVIYFHPKITLKLNSYSNASVFLSLCRMRISVFWGQERLTDRSILKRYLKSDIATWVEKSSTSRAIHALDTGFYWSSENALHERFIASSGDGVWMTTRQLIAKR